MDSIVHGTTVGTNTLLERRGPKIGVITTRGFRDVLEMRRRDRRRTWGLWGDFVPIADRDMRLEVRRADAGRRHASALRSIRLRSALRQSSCWKRARRRSPSLSSTPTPIQRTNARRWQRRRRFGRTTFVDCLARGAVRNPRIRALFHHGAQRLSAAGRGVLSRQARCCSRDAEHSSASCTSCSRMAASCRR